MAIKSFKRYEKKYLLTKEQYRNLLPVLHKYMNLDDHCKGNENYNIYNIYFDTKNNDVIRHSISKPYYKEKLRLRSYKIPDIPKDKVFLELKKKINGIVNKRRVVLPLYEAYDFLSFGKVPVFKDYENNQVIHELEYYLKTNSVSPSIYIGYSREAYFGKENKDFRITFDSSILTRRYELSLEKGHFGENLLKDGEYLMEIKILGAIPLWLTSLLSDLSIYNIHFSKCGNEYINYKVNNRKNNYTERMRLIC